MALKNQQGSLTDVCSLPVSFGGILKQFELNTTWFLPRATLGYAEYSLFLRFYWLFRPLMWRLTAPKLWSVMLWTGCKPEVELIHRSVCVWLLELSVDLQVYTQCVCVLWGEMVHWNFCLWAVWRGGGYNLWWEQPHVTLFLGGCCQACSKHLLNQVKSATEGVWDQEIDCSQCSWLSWCKCSRWSLVNRHVALSTMCLIEKSGRCSLWNMLQAWQNSWQWKVVYMTLVVVYGPKRLDLQQLYDSSFNCC